MKNFRIAILLRTPQQWRRAKLANALDNFQKEEEKMSLMEKKDGQIPDYYLTMYMDGYTPAQILHSAKRGMYQKYKERKQQRGTEKDVRSVLESALHSLLKCLK